LKEFSSKLELNQELLKKDHRINDGEIVVVKKYSTAFGDRETKYLLKKCEQCGELFFQFAKSKHNYVKCDNCAKGKKKEFPKDFI
jgi:formylmethanofuran dehydrogenase subunit E